MSWRHQYSDRHFTGSHEDVEREEEGSEVKNDVNIADIGVRWNVDSRWSISAGIPFLMATRSSAIRNSAREVVDRYQVQARGLGDISVTARRMMFDPATSNGNVTLGLGLELPTGQPNVTDTRLGLQGDTLVVRTGIATVDQSIQPGDGGFGIIADMSGFRRFGSDKFAAYGSGTYFLTPEEKSGVQTYRGAANESEMSIADAYLVRAGMTFFPTSSLALSAGGRIEGVKVEDLIGGSEGFRRPGYAVSVEPAISYQKGQHSASFSLPIAVHRNRKRSVPDQEVEGRHGDAAFADYVFLFGYTRRIG